MLRTVLLAAGLAGSIAAVWLSVKAVARSYRTAKKSNGLAAVVWVAGMAGLGLFGKAFFEAVAAPKWVCEKLPAIMIAAAFIAGLYIRYNADQKAQEEDMNKSE